MSKYMLIDITKEEETKILCIAGIREIQLWGQYHKLKGRKVIAPPVEARGFSKLELLPLQYLFWNSFQQPPAELYKDLIQNCLKMVNDLPITDTPLKAIENMVDALRPIDSDGAGRKKSTHLKEPRDPNARPKAGTVTGDVWDLCDELVKKLGRIPERKEAIEYCGEEAGVHKATASTQYAKWKKASKNIEENA